MTAFEQAIIFAVRAHEGQRRRGESTPYIIHPMEVAAICASMTSDEDVLAAAVLHDTVEDTDVTVEEIREIFGDEIADAVALMTHANGVPYMDYVKEIGKNPLARKVKLADLTHNMDIRRIRNPRQKDYDRIEKKYKPAYEYLKGV